MSDTRGRVTDAYGLADEELNHHAGVPKRALVPVEDTRTVRDTWTAVEPYEEPSIEDFHQSVKSLDDP